MPVEFTQEQVETQIYKGAKITAFAVDTEALVVNIMYDKGIFDALGQFIVKKKGEVDTFTGQEVQDIMAKATQYTIAQQDIYAGLKQALYEALLARTGFQGVVK